MEFYYHELKEILKNLNLVVEKFPSLKDFMTEFHGKMFYGEILPRRNNYGIVEKLMEFLSNNPELFYLGNFRQNYFFNF